MLSMILYGFSLNTNQLYFYLLFSCSAGYNGHDCLLRAICEAAIIPLGMHNGVLGDIMHIILTYAVCYTVY